jgi:hypothetical protein
MGVNKRLKSVQFADSRVKIRNIGTVNSLVRFSIKFNSQLNSQLNPQSKARCLVFLSLSPQTIQFHHFHWKRLIKYLFIELTKNSVSMIHQTRQVSTYTTATSYHDMQFIKIYIRNWMKIMWIFINDFNVILGLNIYFLILIFYGSKHWKLSASYLKIIKNCFKNLQKKKNFYQKKTFLWWDLYIL